MPPKVDDTRGNSLFRDPERQSKLFFLASPIAMNDHRGRGGLGRRKKDCRDIISFRFDLYPFDNHYDVPLYAIIPFFAGSLQIYILLNYRIYAK